MGTRRLGLTYDADWKGGPDTRRMGDDLKAAGKKGEEASQGLKQTESAAGGLNRSMKLLIGGGALLGAGKLLLDFGRQAVMAASDVGEMQSKFNTVFRDLATDVKKDLEEFADAAGRSTFELMGYAATLQDTFVPLGFARDAAADMSIELVKLSEDLASFNNLNTDEVVRDLQSALVGNTETLRKYGVVASQAAIEQYALEKGMISHKRELDAQIKAQAILGLTLDGTTDAQGDAIKTADSLANKQKALEAATQELYVAFGQLLVPAVTAGVTAVTEYVSEGAEAVQVINDMNAAADGAIKSSNEAAAATDDWATHGRKLATVLEENDDILFSIFGDGKIKAEVIDLAKKTADFTGTNEDLERSLKEVFGSSAKVKGELIAIGGAGIITVDNLRELTAEYILQEQQARLMAEATAAASYDQKYFNEQLEETPALLDELTDASINAVDGLELQRGAQERLAEATTMTKDTHQEATLAFEATYGATITVVDGMVRLAEIEEEAAARAEELANKTKRVSDSLYEIQDAPKDFRIKLNIDGLDQLERLRKGVLSEPGNMPGKTAADQDESWVGNMGNPFNDDPGKVQPPSAPVNTGPASNPLQRVTVNQYISGANNPQDAADRAAGSTAEALGALN